jgi:hypothetical protein
VLLRQTIFLFVLLAVSVLPASAQLYDFSGRSMSVENALEEVRKRGGVDLVFSSRLVENLTTRCRYRGSDLAMALECILADTGLQAARVHRRQYVIVRGETGGLDPVRTVVLSGFVIDAKTGEPLQAAHVWMQELGSGVITNRAGYFAIPGLPATRFVVRISYLGYAAVDTVLLAGVLPGPIMLHPDALEATGIEIAASRRERPDLSVMPGLTNAPTTVLSTMPVTLGEQDLFQALQWLPGIRSSGEINGGLVIRGQEPDHSLYLLDGAPMYHPWHAFSLVSTFQTNTLKQVRLYRGGLPAEHGGRLAGVLEAEMRDGTTDVPTASAALSPLSGRFVIESPLAARSSFMVSGRRSYIDKLIGREHPVEGSDGNLDTLRTGYFFSDFGAKFTQRYKYGQRLSLSYYHGSDELDLRLPFDVSLDLSSWLRPADLFFEIDQSWGNRIASARYEALLNGRFFMTLTGYWSRYNAKEGTFIQPTSASALTSRYSVDLNDFGLRADLDYYLNTRHQLRTGVHVAAYRFESELDALVERSFLAVDTLYQESRLVASEWTAYVQDHYRPSRRFEVVAGIRTGYFDNGAHFRLSPRLAFQYDALPGHVVLRGSAGMQSQFLHRLRDRYSFLYDLVSSRWIPSNHAVDPSDGVQASAGLEVRPARKVLLLADVYYTQTRNVLLPEDEYRQKDGIEGPGIEVGTLLSQYVTGRSRGYGLELGLEYSFYDWVLNVAYSGGRSLARAAALGEMTYRPARFDVPRALQGTLTWHPGRWHMALGWEGRSGYPHTVPVARYRIGDPLDPDGELYLHRPQINNGRLPAYVRFDLTMGTQFRIAASNWTASVHLYNVTNRRNVVGRLYNPAETVVTRTDRRGFPLLPLFELEVKL